MQRIVLTVVWVLALASAAVAGNFVCGDPTKLVLYSVGFDPTTVPPCPAPFLLSAIPKGPAIQQQQAFYDSMARKDHIKVVNGLMVAMTAAEQQAVDNALALAKQPVTEAQGEIQTNDICNTLLTNLADLEAKKNTLRQRVADNVNNAATNAEKTQALIGNDQDLVTWLFKLAKCVNSYAVVRGAPTAPPPP